MSLLTSAATGSTTAAMTNSLTRRQFLTRTTATAAGLWLPAPQILRAPGVLSANDKLNIGVIGVAGQGGYSIGELNKLGHILVALCDVDEKRLDPVAQKFPAAKTYRDFQRLMDQKDLDAIVV